MLSDPVIPLLADLVSIDSINPSLVAGARGEENVARRIAAELDAIGCVIEVTYVAEDRPNVVGVLNGRAPGRTLMLCGHTDTVGVEGMAHPFAAEIRDGKLYGRGAQDMKGGLAAMIGAARRIVDGGGLDRGRLIIAAVADEEHASLGADALVNGWRADAAVVTEPTGLDVAVCHKGFQWVRVETRGTAAHGSRPSDGRDAILRLGRFLHRLESLDRHIQRGRAHPLLGTASLHASLIEGGHELSSYPRRARLIFERRTLPGESSEVALSEANEILDALRADDAEFEGEATALLGRGGYEIDAANPLPDLLVQSASAVGVSPSRVGMTFWTDAAILGAAGIPSVLFGPGGAGLHSREEYVFIDDVCRCRDVLVELARAFV
jgi:acetylornithine deacetylase/succinyl-diaminopimelate desuccinylase-like protein